MAPDCVGGLVERSKTLILYPSGGVGSTYRGLESHTFCHFRWEQMTPKKIQKYIPFVKPQMEFHSRQAKRFESDPRRHKLHSGTSATFSDLLDFLSGIEERTPEESHTGNNLVLGWSELQGLSEELMSEPSITESDKLDYSIVELVAQQGGMASLDRIIVEIFQLTGEILKRQNLNARLYRMAQKGMLFSVPGKKGVYSCHEVQGVDAPMNELNS